MDILIGIICIALILSIAVFIRTIEKKEFNDGICSECSSDLDLLYSGIWMRGYICHNCFKTVWVTFNVDKEYVRSSVD